MGTLLHLGPTFVLVRKITQYPLTLAFLVLFASLTLCMLPNVHQRKKHALVAAVITTALWILATFLFRLYVQHFPPNPAYGVVDGIIIVDVLHDGHRVGRG